MKEQLNVKFYNPNDEEEMAIYLCDMLVEMLVERIEEDPKELKKKISELIDGGDS